MYPMYSHRSRIFLIPWRVILRMPITIMLCKFDYVDFTTVFYNKARKTKEIYLDCVEFDQMSDTI